MLLLGKLRIQVVPQSMPLGVLVTVPDPAPDGDTVSVTVSGSSSNRAVTVWLVVIVRLHEAVPLHPGSLQPVKIEPTAAVADNVTVLPLAKAALQLTGGPQSIPAWALLTCPVPVPILVTVNVAVLGAAVKTAVTV